MMRKIGSLNRPERGLRWTFPGSHGECYAERFSSTQAFAPFYSLQNRRDNNGDKVATCRNLLRNL
jgi:hypothetical protein